MAWEWLQTLGGGTLTTIPYSWGDIPTRIDASNISFGDVGVNNISEPIDYKFYFDTENDFYYYVSGSTKNRLSMGLHLPSGKTIGQTQSSGSEQTNSCTIAIQIDNTLQEARFVFLELTTTWTPKWNSYKVYSYEQELYQAIINTPQPPQYNWQSVLSISGKNGILRLVKLASDAINNGDPVSGASSSAFTKAPSAENNIKNLVDIILEPVATDSSATIFYTIPALKNDSYSSVKIYAKIGEVPKCDETDDIVEDIDPTINEISLENLEYETEYFFCIQSISNNGLKLSSNVENIMTGELEGTTFDFTGNEQTFVVPETGMYSLETWGAQGQNDENNRGGYGAYAYTEAFLTQGQTLYINVGGQNGYNGGGNFSSGNIRNIAIPDFNQSIIIDYSLWTNDWDSGRVTVGSIPKKFTIGYDFLGLVMNAALGTESVLIFERNGVKIYGMRDNRNASYGGYYKYSVYIKDGDEIVAGSQYPDVYSPQSWFLASGFDRRDSMYNSNVWSRIQALYLGFGVDDKARLGYMVGCAKWHQGYYQGVYINDDSFTSKKISNNTAQYGTYCNSAKLYDALKKMAGE